MDLVTARLRVTLESGTGCGMQESQTYLDLLNQVRSLGG